MKITLFQTVLYALKLLLCLKQNLIQLAISHYMKKPFSLIIHISCIVQIILCELPQQKDQVYMKRFNNSSCCLWSLCLCVSLHVRVRVRVCELYLMLWRAIFTVWAGFHWWRKWQPVFLKSQIEICEVDDGGNTPTSPSKGRWAECVGVIH